MTEYTDIDGKAINREDLTHMYRYEGYVNEDYCGLIESGNVSVNIQTYRIERHTPRGVYLFNYGGKQRFVLLSGRKRYAYPTEEEALKSFIERKRRQVRLLRSQIDSAEAQRDHACWMYSDMTGNTP